MVGGVNSAHLLQLGCRPEIIFGQSVILQMATTAKAVDSHARDHVATILCGSSAIPFHEGCPLLNCPTSLSVDEVLKPIFYVPQRRFRKGFD